MPLSLTAFAKGATIVVTWERNSRADSKYPVIANKTELGRAPKMIVPVQVKGFQPQPFEKWECTVESSKGKRDGFGTIKVIPKRRIVEFDIEGVWVDPGEANLMLIGLQDPDCNVMLEGPSGVGKTTLGQAFAEKLGAIYKPVAGNAIKKVNQLTGKTNAGSSHDKLLFWYADSEFTKAIKFARDNQDKRVFIHVDEITRMDEDARDMTLNLLEGRVRQISVNGEEVEVGRNIIWYATGNVGSSGQFVLKRQDSAFKSRWLIFRVGYMPHAVELKMCLTRNPGCPERQMDIALTIINKIRKAHVTNTLAVPKGPSPRESLNTAKLLSQARDVQLDRVLGITVVNQYDGYIENPHQDAGKVAVFIRDQLKELKCPVNYLEARIGCDALAA